LPRAFFGACRPFLNEPTDTIAEGDVKSMVRAPIRKSTAVFKLVAFLGLAVVELINQTDAAEPATPIAQPEPKPRSQVTTPEPAALVQSYETSLAPYRRMRARWTLQFAKSSPDQEAQHEESTVQWAVYRDSDRLRLLQTTDSEKRHEVFETLWQAEQQVSVFADGTIHAWLQPSARSKLDHLGGSPCSPCYGIIDQKWIPDFLRTAKLSVQAMTLEGRPLYRLRGLTMDTKIEVWIDPSLGYAARRIRFDKRASQDDPTLRSQQVDATRFRVEKGHHVVTEATTTWSVGPQPLFSSTIVEKNGKRVAADLPARDKDGNVIILPERRYVYKIELRDIDFDPKWTDRDLQFSRPIANFTKVSMAGAADSNYVWLDGRVVLMAPGRAP
jgi:hypothetical protein